MQVFGKESIQSELTNAGYFFKGLLNQNAIALFPAVNGGREVQHSETKVGGLSYEENYKGNALALVIKPGIIEIRFHDRFSDDRVGAIVKEVKSLEGLEFARNFKVTYQGRIIDPGVQG